MTLLSFSVSGFSQSKQTNVKSDGIILSADSIRMKDEVSIFISSLKSKANSEIQDSASLCLVYYNLAICYSAMDLVDSSCYFLYLALDQQPIF